MARLVVEADGKPRLAEAVPEPYGENRKKAAYQPQWSVYQNLFDRDYTVDSRRHPASPHPRTEGDWLEIGQIGLRPPRTREGNRRRPQAGVRQEAATVPLRPATRRTVLGLPSQDRAWLWKQCIEPWKKAEGQGTGVMVGEWGVFNRTPHDVVLRWAEDCLANWQKAGWGWAMWNFRGSMGVMDSDAAMSATRTTRATSSTASSWTCSAHTDSHAIPRKRLDVQEQFPSRKSAVVSRGLTASGDFRVLAAQGTSAERTYRSAFAPA